MNQVVVDSRYSFSCKSHIAILVLCMLLFASAATRGNTWVWTGGGGANGNWNNSGNWGSAGIPANGDSVVFQGVAGLNSTNNIAGLTLSQIRFIAGGFNLYGNPFTLTNSIVATNFSGSIAIYPGFAISSGGTNVLMLISNSITLTLYGNISGTVGVNKAGLGTVTYSGPSDNTYTGTTLVSAGTLQLDVFGFNAFFGPLVIGDGTGTGTPVVRDVMYQEIPDTGQVTVNLGGLLDLNNNNEIIGGLTLSGGSTTSGTGTLILSANSTITLSNNMVSYIYGNLNNGSGTLTVQGIGELYFYANVSGLANTVLNDTVYTFWLGNNTFSGNVTDNSVWPIVLESSTALGNITNKLTLNGSSFVDVYGSINLTNQTVTFNNTNIYNAVYGSIDDFGGGSSSWQASFVLAGNCIANVATNCTLSLIGPVSGPDSITKVGPGTLIFSGSAGNSYAGLTTVNEGELDMNKPDFVEAVPAFGPGLVIGDGTHTATVRNLNNRQIYSVVTPVTITNLGLLDLNGFVDEDAPLTMNGGQITTGAGQIILNGVVTVGSGASTISGHAGLDGSIVVSNSILIASPYSSELFMPANVSGAQGITKAGLGGLYLSASNSYAGLTTVQQGWLWAQNPWALGGTASGTVVSNGATLVLDGSIGITNESLTLNGPGFSSVWGSLDVETGINTWAGPITDNANSTLDSWTAGSELHINGPISGPGSMESFGYSGGGGTIFYEGSAGNTYGGVTMIDVGSTLLLNKSVFYASVPGNAVVSGTLRLANNEQIATSADVLVNSGGLFDFSTHYQDINTLRGTGNVTFGTLGYLNIGANGGTSEFDGTMSGIGFTGGYTVAKAGTGTFTLTGTNTYLNRTDVDGGTLIINGSQLQSPVFVSSGTTLGGSGIVGNITAVGTVSPGNNGPGILTCSNLTFTSSGKYVVDLDGPTQGTTYDLINPLAFGPSNILANATLQVDPNFTSPVSIGQQFTVISNATPNLFNGTFNALPEGSLLTMGGYTFRVSYVGGTGNDVVLTLLGIPGDTVTVNSVDKGWYDSTGFHGSGNKNYFAGVLGGSTNVYRNFFVFNVPLSSSPIVHAELFVNNYTDINTNGQQTYIVRKVATPIPTLEAGGSGLTGIFNGLGTNSVYAVRSVATNEFGQKSIIPLNAQFMNDAMAASGGQLAIGGMIAGLNTTNNQTQCLFANSGTAVDDAQLRLTYGTNILINAANRGWYTSAGSHTAGNLNYIVGDNGSGIFRNYFVFNLPAISGQLVDAQLLLNAYTISSVNASENYELYDVTNTIAALEASQTTAVNIFNDLGGGSVYGGRDVYVSESGQTVTMPLNGNFLAAAQANGSGSFALGGAVTTLGSFPTVQEMFAFSGSTPADVQLWLGFYALPISHTTFAGNTPAYLGNGQYLFSLSGASNSTNEIQASFDFQRWDYIADVKLSGTTGTFNYTNNTVMPYRFFRAEPLQ